jgi:hypothetical protein
MFYQASPNKALSAGKQRQRKRESKSELQDPFKKNQNCKLEERQYTSEQRHTKKGKHLALPAWVNIKISFPKKTSKFPLYIYYVD